MIRKSGRARRDEAGFSFVELLVTILIAGIAFAAMVPLFVNAQRAGAADRVRMTALNVARDRVEKIRQLDYDLITEDNLLSTTNTPTWLYSDEFGPEWQTSSGRVFHIDYDVPAPLIDENGKSMYKVVTVRVTWAPGPVDIDGTDAVTLRTFIYQQYAGPQIVDLYMVSPVGLAVDTSASPVSINWDAAMGTLNVQLAAILNPADDNAGVKYVTFVGYGAGSVPVVSEDVSTRTGSPARFTVTWTPATDGSADGLYRFEATAYSAVGGFAGNTFVEEYRLESGPPPAPTGISVTEAETSVDLIWASSPAADVVKYEVWRWTDGDAPARVDDDLVTAAFFHDTAVVTGTTYHYYLVAVDSDGNRSANSVTKDATPHASVDVTAPPVPVVVSTPAVRQAILTWVDVVDPVVGTDPASGISYYIVYREDGETYRRDSPMMPGAPVSWGQSITQAHTYTVTSVDVAGNESAPSLSVPIAYTVPSHLMIMSSNKNCDFTVTDSLGVVVGTKSNSKSYQLTLPEGTYYVKAFRAGVTRGPVPVVNDQDPENVPAFSF
jgi:hypothetical protein